MKKLLALCSALLLTFTAHAAQFEEGKHYKVLDVKKASKPVVT
ncbi:thiol:disulfide interchange protein DsbA/DsbL, partial [Vibrio parahaemolyticus]|nr:thiol:disulfide interchange protein DsbA/DsbL [Vibrio parahaemolyticus]NMU76587.1 thiol:disulfide interchange protein DsbA/DsbL [Vibrio parahaemolyticus]